VTFDEYLASLTPFEPKAAGTEPDALELCERATLTIAALDPLDVENLSRVVERDPKIAQVLAAVVGLGHERFKTWLKSRFNTSGWIILGKQRGPELVERLDDEFGLIALLKAQSERQWTWADVLARIMAPRTTAGGSIQQGRELEDEVEIRVKALGVPYEVRTRFAGKGGRDAPADFAIPGGGANASPRSTGSSTGYWAPTSWFCRPGTTTKST
jgi:hypothetical protein